MTLASAATLASTGETAGSIALAIAGIAFVLAGIVLFIAGVVSVFRSGNYQSGGKAVWILLMLAFPFLGPVTWFIWGRNSTIQGPAQPV
ncbi:PLDc_N domain-containing protein [Nocardia uniformis]|uniref:PLDc_N domain-containing protein n=2 Tax=Nocardia uniformis TaxID=53432 RepID=A0A849C2A4_9NOCA|nr:PLDc_N domain-containing protein [Nocardia uniformis]